MPTTIPNNNEVLLFDVLGLIFSHYAMEETIHHPLETLLLVCRSWSDAALGHQALWSNLKIYLGHCPTTTVWSTLLPLRLARAGPTTPLYIDLRNFLTTPHDADIPEHIKNDEIYTPFSCGVHRQNNEEDDDECLCYDAVKDCITSSLVLLAGNNGSLCSRWRQLRLELGHREGGWDMNDELTKFFSRPTPSLTNLTLKNISIFEDSLFPETPLLEDISIIDCDLGSLPAFHNVSRAQIGWKESDEFQFITGLRDATRLRSLTLHVPFFADIPIPRYMPYLIRFGLSGNNFPADLYLCEMPNLMALEIDFQYENLLAHMLRCKGIHLKRLQILFLKWDIPLFPTTEQVIDILEAIVQLLLRASDLTCILGNKHMLNVLFKALWYYQFCCKEGGDNAVRPLLRNVLIIDNTNGQRIYIDGSETIEELEEYAKSWDLIPMALSMEWFAEQLKARAGYDALFY